MTQDFAPPGGSPSAGGPGDNRPDARASSPSSTSRSGAQWDANGSSPNMFQAGRRVAFAAWVAIVAGVVLLVGIGWSAALALGDDTLSYAELGETGAVNAVQVVPGMCLTGVDSDGAVQGTEVVRCDEPHGAEVFTQMTFDLAKHPGADQVTEQALEFCGDRLGGLLPESATWVAWTPSEQSWARGDRVALCIAVFDEPLSEPLSPNGLRGIDARDANYDGLDA